MFRLFFCIFLLLFFRYAQGDVVAYMESLLLHRTVESWPWLSAVVLTALLMALGRVGEKVLSRLGESAESAYVFIAWVAAALVSIPYASWIYQCVLFGVAVVLFAGFVGWNRRNKRCWKDTRTLWQNFIPSAVQLLLLCLYVGAGAAATDTDHYELRTAEAIRTQHPKRAYKVGEKSLAVTPRLFALRCYLMARTEKQGLAHQIFKQPVPAGGSGNLLFPNDEMQELIFSSENLYRLLGDSPLPGESRLAYLERCATAASQVAKKSKRVSAPIDYYLCALLLDRRLDLFAREVKRLYPDLVSRSKLPVYFAQALVYYNRTRTQPIVFYQDAAVEANYKDYTDMADTIPDLKRRVNLLRRSYGETYWWWFEYGNL